LFCREHSNMISALREAVAENNAPAIRSAAHVLKGSLAVFCAKQATALTARLEDSARAGQLARTGEMLSDLEGEVQKVRADLEQLSSTGTAPNSGSQPAADGKEIS
jgi:HPt (histidine-containing phosphotransfer) domain-containing protein